MRPSNGCSVLRVLSRCFTRATEDQAVANGTGVVLAATPDCDGEACRCGVAAAVGGGAGHDPATDLEEAARGGSARDWNRPVYVVGCGDLVGDTHPLRLPRCPNHLRPRSADRRRGLVEVESRYHDRARPCVFPYQIRARTPPKKPRNASERAAPRGSDEGSRTSCHGKRL